MYHKFLQVLTIYNYSILEHRILLLYQEISILLGNYMDINYCQRCCYSVGGNYSSTAVPRDTRCKVTIPSILGGYSVTSVGSDAFYGCSGLQVLQGGCGAAVGVRLAGTARPTLGGSPHQAGIAPTGLYRRQDCGVSSQRDTSIMGLTFCHFHDVLHLELEYET